MKSEAKATGIPVIPTLSVEATWLPPSIPGGEWWVVMAYHQQGRWKLFDSLWDGEFYAKEEAQRLASCWIGRVVLHVTVPVRKERER